MIRNFIITALSVAILTYCVRAFKNWKYASNKKRKFVPIVILLWSVMVGIPNIPVILAPFSPPIKGQIKDAETGQPITNSYIKANWEIEQLGLAGGHWETYHQQIIKTNAQGEFHVPRHLKPLGVYGLLPLFLLADHYNGLSIMVNALGYNTETATIDSSKQRSTFYEIPINISMQRLTPSSINSRYLESNFKSKNCPWGTITEDDKMFIKDDNNYIYVHFDEIFKHADLKEVGSALIHIGGSFRDSGNFPKAIELYQRLKLMAPEHATFANQEIAEINRRLSHSNDSGKKR